MNEKNKNPKTNLLITLGGKSGVTESHLCCLLAVVKWENYLNSLDLSFLLFKMEIRCLYPWIVVEIKTGGMSKHA